MGASTAAAGRTVPPIQSARASPRQARRRLLDTPNGRSGHRRPRIGRRSGRRPGGRRRWPAPGPLASRRARPRGQGHRRARGRPAFPRAKAAKPRAGHGMAKSDPSAPVEALVAAARSCAIEGTGLAGAHERGRPTRAGNAAGGPHRARGASRGGSGRSHRRARRALGPRTPRGRWVSTRGRGCAPAPAEARDLRAARSALEEGRPPGAGFAPLEQQRRLPVPRPRWPSWDTASRSDAPSLPA